MNITKLILYSANEDGPYYAGDYQSAYEEYIETFGPLDCDSTDNFTAKFLEENLTIELFECEFIKYSASQYIRPDLIIENAQQHAYDQVGLEDFDWLDGLTQPQQDDLKTVMAKAFDEWATKHNLQPTFSECTGKTNSILVKPLTATTYEIINQPKQGE